MDKTTEARRWVRNEQRRELRTQQRQQIQHVVAAGPLGVDDSWKDFFMFETVDSGGLL